MLPNNIPNSFFLVSEIEAASSGKLVPIATSVNPTSSSGTPTKFARFLAPNTRESEPIQSAVVATKTITQDIWIGVLMLSSAFELLDVTKLFVFRFLSAFLEMKNR